MSLSGPFSTQGITEQPEPDFIRDVRDGLLRFGQKELPSKYLYDELGSALSGHHWKAGHDR